MPTTKPDSTDKNQQQSGRWFNCSSNGIGPSGYSLPGVYVIFISGKPIYVGQSQNVTNRIIQHYKYFDHRILRPDGFEIMWQGRVCMRASTGYPRVRYMMAYEPLLAARMKRESALIRRLQPLANIQGTHHA